jgi:hypothetical protein
MFPAEGGYTNQLPQRFVSTLQLLELTAALLQLGYREADVRALLGGSFLRVALKSGSEMCWCVPRSSTTSRPRDGPTLRLIQGEPPCTLALGLRSTRTTVGTDSLS